jgi:chaperonin GroEL (HSP60 family)
MAQVCELKKPRVLVTDYSLIYAYQLIPILELVVSEQSHDDVNSGLPCGVMFMRTQIAKRLICGRWVVVTQAKTREPLLIVAEETKDEALALLSVNRIRGLIDVCSVKAPFAGQRRKVRRS